MAQPNFDYEGAIDAGYSQDEINNFLRQQPSYKSVNKEQGFFSNIVNNASNFIGNIGKSTGTQQQPQQLPSQQDLINPKLLKHTPNFDVNAAMQAGYSADEINDFLQQQIPERSMLEKGGRIGTQFAIGATEAMALPYEIAALPMASPEAQEVVYRQNVMDDLEQMAERRIGAKFGIGEWTPEDEKYYQNLEEQIKHPEKAEPFVKAADIGVRGLAEKATGLDLHPEGVLEKGAAWLGFIRNPLNFAKVGEWGLKPKELIKAITPTGTELGRSATAGAALQMAEEGHFGPAGTLGAAIAGDLLGYGPGGLLYAARHPKKAAAEIINLFGRGKANSKEAWIKELVADAREAGIPLDAGTLTNSNIVRMAQARAAQSALSGDALDNFRKNLSQQIVNEYGKVVDGLGTLSFENSHQAAESVRNFVANEERNLFQKFGPGEQREARPLVGRVAVEERPAYQAELLNQIAPQEFRNSYEAGETLKTAAEDIKAPIKEEFSRRWDNLNREIEMVPGGPQPGLARMLDNFIEEQQGSLLLGESSAENRVLQAATRLRNSLMTEEGGLIGVSLRDLMKTKRTLGDIANWEFGGSNFQSAYKQLVGEIDRAIEHTLGEVNPALRGAYEQLNAEYSMFKNQFENKNVLPLFEPRNENYNTVYNGFLKSPDKMRSLEDILFDSPRGQQLISQMKRDYASRIIEKPNVTARELRDLTNVLGPQYEGPISNFIAQRQRAIEHPLPRAARQPALGTRVEIPETRAEKSLAGRGVPKAEHGRQKLFEYIRGKDSEQIMKMMDSVEGIRKLKSLLKLSPEGAELFDKLARYKLFEMIDKNMMDNVGENIKLGKFSGLLKSSKSHAIVKELVGDEAFKRLNRLQKVSGHLQASADKFYNASKSGTTLADVGLVSTAITGILTGNPYTVILPIAGVSGMRIGSKLLANAEFLKYLEEAVLTTNKEKFLKVLEKMKPAVVQAIVKASLEAKGED